MSAAAPDRESTRYRDAALAVVAVASGVLLTPYIGIVICGILAAMLPGRRRVFLLIGLGWLVFLLLSFPMFGGGESGGGSL